MDFRKPGYERELNMRLREAALVNDGVITSENLAALGFSRGMVTRRKASGLLIPILKGSYALTGAALTERGRLRAAVNSGREGLVVSHASALSLHEMISSPASVHVTGTTRAFRDSIAGRWESGNFGFRVVRHETRHLPEDHVTEIDGIRVTTAERSVRDYAATAAPAQITRALTQGEKERVFCWAKLRAIAASSRGHRGIVTLNAEIDAWDPVFADTASDPEIDSLLMIRGESLPLPLVNVKIGRWTVDFYWPHLRLVVELDPYGTHSGKESHRRDHRKGIELEAMGLRVVRFTWEDRYLHEQRTATELRKIMEHQARLLRCPLFPPR